MLAFFESSFLDVEATKRQVATDLSGQLAEVEAQAKRAAGEASRLTLQRAKVERDYLGGTLPSEVFAPMAGRLDSEKLATEAEAKRLSDHAAELRDGIEHLDEEHEALVRLAGLRDAIARHVRSADEERDVAALRSALAQCFDSIMLRVAGGVGAVEPAASATAWALHAFPVPLPKRDPILRGSGVPE